MNAVAYLRVSGQSQIEGTGFDRQLKSCFKLGSSLKMTVLRVFREEAISGTKDVQARPAFQEMVAYMLDTGIKIVIIEEMGRLAREYRIQEQLLLYLAAKKLTLYAANTGENITEAILADPMRKALVQIQGVFAELDKSMIVAKLRKGRERTKAIEGRCEGQKPYGGDPKHPEEIEILAEIRRLRTTGIFCYQVADELNTRGILARSGGLWSAQVISKILRRNKVTPDLRSDCAASLPSSAIHESSLCSAD
jgi:DNA invertase Pin-like site-specific DNA recombinase